MALNPNQENTEISLPFDIVFMNKFQKNTINQYNMFLNFSNEITKENESEFFVKL